MRKAFALLRRVPVLTYVSLVPLLGAIWLLRNALGHRQAFTIELGQPTRLASANWWSLDNVFVVLGYVLPVIYVLALIYPIWLIISTVRNKAFSLRRKIVHIAGHLVILLFLLGTVLGTPMLLNNSVRTRFVFASGTLRAPTRAYERSAETVEVLLAARPAGTLVETLRPSTGSKAEIQLTVPFSGPDDTLQIELIAPGVAVDGDKKQSQRFSTQPMRYRWSLFFDTVGDYLLTLRYDVVSSGTSVYTVYSSDHEVAVRDFLNLPRPVVFGLAALVGLLSVLANGVTIAQWRAKQQKKPQAPRVDGTPPESHLKRPRPR